MEHPHPHPLQNPDSVTKDHRLVHCPPNQTARTYAATTTRSLAEGFRPWNTGAFTEYQRSERTFEHLSYANLDMSTFAIHWPYSKPV